MPARSVIAPPQIPRRTPESSVPTGGKAPVARPAGRPPRRRTSRRGANWSSPGKQNPGPETPRSAPAAEPAPGGSVVPEKGWRIANSSAGQDRQTQESVVSGWVHAEPSLYPRAAKCQNENYILTKKHQQVL